MRWNLCRCYMHQTVLVWWTRDKKLCQLCLTELNEIMLNIIKNYEWNAYKNNFLARWYETRIKSNFDYFECNGNWFLVVTATENWFSFIVACQFFAWSRLAFTFLELEYRGFDINDYMIMFLFLFIIVLSLHTK